MIVAVDDMVIIEGDLQHVGERHVRPVWLGHDLLWLDDVVEAASTVTLHPDPAILGGIKSGYVRHVPLIGRLTRANYRATPEGQLVLPRYARRKLVEPYIIIELRRDLWHDEIHPPAIL